MRKARLLRRRRGSNPVLKNRRQQGFGEVVDAEITPHCKSAAFKHMFCNVTPMIIELYVTLWDLKYPGR